MRDVEFLAAHRVKTEGGRSYKALEMSADEILERRSYIRRKLANHPTFCNADNSAVNQILLYQAGNDLFVADADGYEYYIPFCGVSAKEAEFRKARAMMPFDFMDLTGKDFDWTVYRADVAACKGIVNQYIMRFEKFKENGMGLYICSGTKGSGKTMLSCCILNEIAKRYIGSVKFINALDLVELTKKGFNGGDDEVLQLYAASLLVIDDIGVQISKEWTDTVFYRLINDRYTNKRPTIYTSNLPVDRLKMDERITDRIESTTYLIPLPEEPVRRTLRQQEKDALLDQIKNGPDRRANTGGDHATAKKP